MKAGDVLDAIETVKPSQYDEDVILQWIEDVESQVFNELVYTHENIEGYERKTMSRNTELVAKSPYDKLYIYYVMAQIDFYNAEIGRFNNDMAMYDAQYSEFANWYNRTYMPLNKSKKGGDVYEGCETQRDGYFDGRNLAVSGD